MSCEFERLPERYYAWPVIWLTLVLVIGLNTGGLVVMALLGGLAGTIVVCALWRSVRQSRDIDRELHLMYEAPQAQTLAVTAG